MPNLAFEMRAVSSAAVGFFCKTITRLLGSPVMHRLFQLLFQHHAWILGSSALHAILSATTWQPGDIDIFIDGVRQDHAIVVALFVELFVQAGFVIVSTSVNGLDEYYREVITLTRARDSVQIQLVVVRAVGHWPAAVLRKFDLSCCCCGFNGRSLYTANWNMSPDLFWVQNGIASDSRIAKYMSRGLTFLEVPPQSAWAVYANLPVPVPLDLGSSSQPSSLPPASPPPAVPVGPPAGLPPAHPPVAPVCKAIVKRSQQPCGRTLPCRHHK